MRERRNYFVYVMGSLSGTLYIGMTGRLERRVFQHKQHTVEGFTSKYEVDRLLYSESYDDVHKAIAREKQLKGWRREKKVALIQSLNPHWVDLSREWYEAIKQQGAGRGASTPLEPSPAKAPRSLSMTPRGRPS